MSSLNKLKSGADERTTVGGAGLGDDAGQRADESKPLDGMSVLIVEDEAIINLDLAMTAESFGARQVVSAHNLEEGRAAVEAGRYDLAVMDLNLPDGDAMPLAAELHGSGVSIVFYSGDDERADILSQFPGAGFVMKPATEQTWIGVIADIVRAKAAR